MAMAAKAAKRIKEGFFGSASRPEIAQPQSPGKQKPRDAPLRMTSVEVIAEVRSLGRRISAGFQREHM